MAGRQYGMIAGRSGHAGIEGGLFALPIDVLTTGEKSPFPKLFEIGDVIMDVYLSIFTAEVTGGTKTVDVGLLSTATSPDADADGFLVGASTAAAGLIRGTLVPTATRGALLKEVSTGGAVHVPRPWIITKADSTVTYTLGGAHTELVADIYVRMWRPPVPLA